MAVSHVRAIVVKLSIPMLLNFFFVPFAAAQGIETILLKTPKPLKPLVRSQEEKGEGVPARRGYRSKHLMKTVLEAIFKPLGFINEKSKVALYYIK